jgi:hypothetical protein
MQNQWSSVGSAGTVDVADIGKVVFAKSVVQLQGFDLVVSTPAPSAAALPVVQTHAVIRYGVTPVQGVLSTQLTLRLRYRDGSGQVVATLIEVDISTGTETPLCRFDSRALGPPSNAFQDKSSDCAQTLNFENHAYYVEVTLTGASHSQQPMFFPPKVSVIQLQQVME